MTDLKCHFFHNFGETVNFGFCVEVPQGQCDNAEGGVLFFFYVDL